MITVTAERLVAGGDALAHAHDGRVMFVRGALPGERVVARVFDERRDFVRAAVHRVLEPAGDRVEPPCAHRVEGCGGCDWMHLAPAGQLAAKRAIVVESLRRTARLDHDLADALVAVRGAVPTSGSRTTLRLVGGADRRVGLRFERSHHVVPLTSCLVAHPALSSMLARLRADEGVEVTVRVSAASGEATAIWDRRRGAVDGLPADVRTGADAWLCERVAGVDLRVSAGSFFQPGPLAAELLVEAVGALAPEADAGRHLVDAYGGVGLFAATVGRRVPRVTVLETSRSACRDAAHNLAGPLARREVSIRRGDVGAWRRRAGDDVDLVVADPARSGLGRTGVRALTSAAPAPMVLVSCDPVSLARDTRLLLDAGYHPRQVLVLDLFPHTHHVETVTRFTPEPVR